MVQPCINGCHFYSTLTLLASMRLRRWPRPRSGCAGSNTRGDAMRMESARRTLQVAPVASRNAQQQPRRDVDRSLVHNAVAWRAGTGPDAERPFRRGGGLVDEPGGSDAVQKPLRPEIAQPGSARGAFHAKLL